MKFGHELNQWYMILYVYLLCICIPGATMTSIFEGQSPKTSPFPTKIRVIWVLGVCVCVYIYIYDHSILHHIKNRFKIYIYIIST